MARTSGADGSDPGGDPVAAATTTVSNVLASPAADGGPVPGTSASSTPSASPKPTPTTSPEPTTPAGSTSPAPAPAVPQWEGDVQVNSLGYSLATVPPSPDQSGDPDISAAFDGTFFAASSTPGDQYAAVRVLAQGRDTSDFPYLRIHATVGPDLGSR